MNARRLSLWVALLLALLGVSGALWRAQVRQQMRLAHGDSLWRLRYAVDFYAEKRGARLHLASPLDTARSRVFRQEMYHRGLTTARHMAGVRNQREIELVAEREGALRVTAQFDIHVSPESSWRAWGATEAQVVPTNGGVSSAVSRALAELRTRAAASNLVMTLFTFTASELAEGAADEPGDVDTMLAHKTAPPGGKARALVALCRAANLPARLVTGFELEPADISRSSGRRYFTGKSGSPTIRSAVSRVRCRPVLSRCAARPRNWRGARSSAT